MDCKHIPLCEPGYNTSVKMVKRQLKPFLNLDGVLAAFVVGEDGSIVEGQGSDMVDRTALGCRVADTCAASQGIAEELWKEDPSMIFVELDNAFCILVPLSAGYIFSVMARGDANIGRIKYEIKKHRDAIIAAL
jgi:predicted regulator of Ras-like GTPase activity (Roadblock/LC7/MglB family)